MSKTTTILKIHTELHACEDEAVQMTFFKVSGKALTDMYHLLHNAEAEYFAFIE